MVQWFGLCTFIAYGTGSIPGQGVKILQAMNSGEEKKKKKMRRGDK